MFGTVSRARLKEGVDVDALVSRMGNPADRPQGSLALIVFRSVSDPREIWIASAFESRDAYFTNAESPEQNARFQEMQASFEGPPEWHDGDVLALLAEDTVRIAS